jgi:hypothetical protein
VVRPLGAGTDAELGCDLDQNVGPQGPRNGAGRQVPYSKRQVSLQEQESLGDFNQLFDWQLVGPGGNQWRERGNGDR